MQHFKIKQQGVSLIELMIALGLGVIIIFGATSSLSTMISSSRVQMSSNDMQQTADRALSYITYRLRNALSTPCDQLNILNDNGKLNINELSGKPSHTVKSKTFKSDEDISSDDAKRIKELLEGQGIDVKQVKRNIAGKDYDNDELAIVNTHGRLFIDGSTGLVNPKVKLQENFPDSVVGNNSLFAITNCEGMDVFRGVVNNKKIYPTNAEFSENYRELESSMVSRLEVSEIKIDNDGYLLNKTLFKNADKDADKDADKLMPDVELIRVFFAVDAKGNDGIADKYIPANQLKNLKAGEKVISAEIFLVIKDGSPESNAVSKDTSLKIPKSDIAKITGDIYEDDNVDTITFDDNVMRRLFVRSVTFRNNASL